MLHKAISFDWNYCHSNNLTGKGYWINSIFIINCSFDHFLLSLVFTTAKRDKDPH